METPGLSPLHTENVPPLDLGQAILGQDPECLMAMGEG